MDLQKGDGLLGYKYNDNEYDISFITATYSEDRDNTPGVCRLTELEIEFDQDISDNDQTEIENEIFNHFAEDEYFTEDGSWRTEAENDIREYTYASSIYIDFE
ncbi:MAG: hypothetical protein MR945_02475 [Agathobacter sp.]|nr:hypothetical protein [Agathobacter sp.]